MDSNEAYELQKKYQEEAQRLKNQQPCPNCGRCPTCGRGGHYTQPYTPIYPQPQYPHPWGPWVTYTVTCNGQ